MRSKPPVFLQRVAILLCVSTIFVGCHKAQPVAAPVANSRTPQQVKELVARLNRPETGPSGPSMKPYIAEALGDLGQAAIDAGAIPELTKLSQSRNVSKEAKDAARAAIAKLNAAATAR